MCMHVCFIHTYLHVTNIVLSLRSSKRCQLSQNSQVKKIHISKKFTIYLIRSNLCLISYMPTGSMILSQ